VLSLPGEDRDLSEAYSESASLIAGQTEDRAAVLAVSAIEIGPDDANRADSPGFEFLVQDAHPRSTLGRIGVCVRLNRGDNMQRAEWGFETITILGRSDDADVELHFRFEVVMPWRVTVCILRQAFGRCPAEVVIGRHTVS